MSVWKTSAPPKIKHFVWRLLCGCLPTRDRLSKKAKHIWQASGLWSLIEKKVDEAKGFHELIFGLLDQLHAINQNSQPSFGLFGSKGMTGFGTTLNPFLLLIVSALLKMVQCNSTVNVYQHLPALLSTNQQHIWTPPPTGFGKCNLDAKIFNNSLPFGIDICIRGEHGHFIQVKMSSFNGIPTLAQAEAWALYHALQWTSHLGYQNVILKATGRQLHVLLSFSNSRVSFVRCQANYVAYSLARGAKFNACNHGSLLKVIAKGVRFAWKPLTVLAIKLDPPLALALQDVTWTVPPFPLARRGDVDGTAIATGDTGHVGKRRRSRLL
ncbi:hypothetical protein GmHk_03G007107 [Glycine max]|nr:hypothetical protein GmHk_03G007107 [Glycine max]